MINFWQDDTYSLVIFVLLGLSGKGFQFIYTKAYKLDKKKENIRK